MVFVKNSLIVLVGLGVLSGCGSETSNAPEVVTTPAPYVRSASTFVAEANQAMRDLVTEVNQAAWVNATYLNDDTQAMLARAQTKWLTLSAKLSHEAADYDATLEDDATARALKLLRLSYQPSPKDPDKTARLAALSASLESAYATARFCDDAGKCLQLSDFENIMATSRDPEALKAAWLNWHALAAPQRDDYVELVSLMNEGAREQGVADVGALWRAGYDQTDAEFKQSVEKTWRQVAPLYEALHCHVRAKLSEYYGDDVVPDNDLIPAYMLGNMWAQTWEATYDLVAPFPEVASDLDLDASLKASKWKPKDLFTSAESFFTSLGFEALPASFYERSMLEKPADRDVICHASAWHIDMQDDVRIKMCTEVNQEDLHTVYHELGHIYYDLAYQHHTPIFQGGANDGFHEAVGDTIVLSMTPGYFEQIGLWQPPVETVFEEAEQREINRQMKVALERVAFLPFGRLVDEWRWRVFAGDIAPEKYSQVWALLREQYQGVRSPGRRGPDTFDPGAKFHVPANTPYMRYYLSFILQFQFHEALCNAAGHDGPLHACSIYGNQAAGQLFKDALAKGASQPWQQTMQSLTGRNHMDAKALLNYFAPLKDWLDNENQGRVCGW